MVPRNVCLRVDNNVGYEEAGPVALDYPWSHVIKLQPSHESTLYVLKFNPISGVLGIPVLTIANGAMDLTQNFELLSI
jgi:hypothetical protein